MLLTPLRRLLLLFPQGSVLWGEGVLIASHGGKPSSAGDHASASRGHAEPRRHAPCDFTRLSLVLGEGNTMVLGNRASRLLLATVVMLALCVPAAYAISATVYYYASDWQAKQSAAIGSSTSVQWKGTLSSSSTGNCYFDLKYGSTSAATAVKASRLQNPGTSFPYSTYTHTSRAFWRAQMNSPLVSTGRVGNSTVYIP